MRLKRLSTFFTIGIAILGVGTTMLLFEAYQRGNAQISAIVPPSPTYNDVISVEGTKPTNTTVIVNGRSGVIEENTTLFTFSANLSLGVNSFMIEYIDGNGSTVNADTFDVTRHGLGDIDYSGVVDVFDLGVFSQYLQTRGGYSTLADLKADEIIDVFDLGIFSGLYENTSYVYGRHFPIPITVIPSPTPIIPTATPTQGGSSALTATPTPSPTVTPTPTTGSTVVSDWYVGPKGSDQNNGTTSTTAFSTIQHALDMAQPGDTIQIADGRYEQDVRSVRNGTQSAPITLRGTRQAVVVGAGNSRIFEINHDYHILDGFTIDGLHGNAASSSGYRDKLIYTVGNEVRNGVEGLQIRFMHLKNAGGECVRIRYFSHYNEIAYSRFENCGVYDFRFNAGGKNGEGVYIGTSPKQLDSDFASGKVPSADPDESFYNYVHHNYFDTQGNECVDIKEASKFNVVADNICVSQFDVESAAFDSRGACNIFEFNQVGQNGSSTILGSAFRLGGANAGDAAYNDIIKNVILAFDTRSNFAIDVPSDDTQGMVCGNVDGNNQTTFGSALSNLSAISNPLTCPHTTTPSGVRGCVGFSCVYQAEYTVRTLPTPVSSGC